MSKLLKKYNALREQYWTHILLPFTYIYCGTYIGLLYYVAAQDMSGGASDFAGVVFAALTLIYIYIYCTIIFLAIINLIFKKKIKNKFLLQNKAYGVIWNIGNILAVIFALCAVLGILYIIFTEVYFKHFI